MMRTKSFILCLAFVLAITAPAAVAQITDEAFKEAMSRYLKTKEGQKELATTVKNYFERERLGPSLDEQFENPLQAEEGVRPAKGPVNAAVVIFEYSDFQCPYCKRAADTTEQILKQYPNDVRLVFKNFPLPPTFHPQAAPAAQASLAAWKQGKFWEMHDALFGNQSQLNQQFYEKKAEELGLNVEQFKKDMQSEEIANMIKEDQAQGRQLGITGTPGFFVKGARGGVVLKGAQPVEKFKEAIDRWLAEAKQKPAAAAGKAR